MGNPYEGYDAIDPLEDDPYDDEEGDFEYVGDPTPLEKDDFAYVDLPAPLEEGDFAYVGDPAPLEEGDFEYVDDGLGADVDSQADALPKTKVRKRAYVELDDESYEHPKHRHKHRHKHKSRKKRHKSDIIYRQGGPAAAGPSPVGDPRMRAQRPRRKHRGCLVTLLFVLACVVGAYWVVCHPIDERLAFSPQEQASAGSSLSWSIPGMPYYVLALGSDAQEGDTYSRSDTMMLIRVDLISSHITMLSIPRDTRVEIEGYGMQKINAAYAFGGAGGAVKAVSKLTGAHISHVAVVHLDELAGLVNYLGGVEVDVPEAAYDPEHTGIDLDAGLQTLDGETAVQWARTRYGYARGDFQRQEDQRILMEAIMKKVLSLSPRAMPGALREVAGLIGTDMRCYNLIPMALRFKLGNPTVYSCSVPSTTATIEGVSYVIADEAALKAMMRTIDVGGDPSSLGY